MAKKQIKKKNSASKRKRPASPAGADTSSVRSKIKPAKRSSAQSPNPSRKRRPARKKSPAKSNLSARSSGKEHSLAANLKLFLQRVVSGEKKKKRSKKGGGHPLLRRLRLGAKARFAMFASTLKETATNPVLQETFLDRVYWLLVLFSLTPLIFSFQGVFRSFRLEPLFKQGDVAKLGWYAVPKFEVFVVIAALMLLVSLLLRRPLLVVASLTPIFASALAWFFLGKDIATVNSADDAGAIYRALTTAYCLSAAGSLILFAFKGRFLSPSVALFAVFALYDSILMAFWDSVDWVGRNLNIFDEGVIKPYEGFLTSLVLDDYGANLIDILAFFVLLAGLRFGSHLVADNHRLVAELLKDKRRLGFAALKAFWMWWLLLAAFLFLVLYAYPRFDAWMEQRSMLALKRHFLCENLVTKEDKSSCVPNRNVENVKLEYEEMMRFMVDYSASQMEIAANQAVQEITNATVATTDELKFKIVPLLSNKVLPLRMPGTHTRGCSKMDIPCHAGNGAKSVANSGYRRLRDPPLRAITKEIDKAHREANGNVEVFRAQSMAIIQESATGYRLRANLAIDKTLHGMFLLSVFSLLYSVMVLIKTYLIAFARVVFDQKGQFGLLARLTEDELRKPRARRQSAIKETTVELISEAPLILRKAENLNFYVQRERQVTAALGIPMTPYPFKSIFRRLLVSKNYVMDFFSFKGDDNPEDAGLQFDQTETVAVVRIREDNRFVFDFPNVVALSTNLRVKTFVTLSLRALVFGRALYRVAEGPGVIVFCIEGQPSVLKSEDVDSSETKRDAKSFVAWQLDTPLKVQSKLSIGGLLLSGYNVAKQRGGVVVVHNNRIVGGVSKMGVARFVRTFLSPI